jgi:hypothetical protein
MPMTLTEKNRITQMIIKYGTKEVMRNINNAQRNLSEEYYRDNPEAIIHEYVPVIHDCYVKLADVEYRRLTDAEENLRIRK